MFLHCDHTFLSVIIFLLKVTKKNVWFVCFPLAVVLLSFSPNCHIFSHDIFDSSLIFQLFGWIVDLEENYKLRYSG